MLPGYSRTSRYDTVQQPCAITSVDLTNRRATATLRDGSEVPLCIDFHVGAVQVTPAIGEQWLIEKISGTWRLHSRLPFQTPDHLKEPTQGQTQIGSTGPTEVNGGQININAPMATHSVSTTARPDATSVPAGTQIYDTTLGKPIWSNGTNWHDAAGTTV